MGESGVGEATSGEGVYGLRRALVMAGSETRVMSLWQVDTGRTRELMQAYYQKLQQGGGRSEAMREVQLAVLANPETAHPNLWASFIVSGEWRTLEGQARLPDMGKVAPGLRGCTCSLAGDEPRNDGAWLTLIVLAAVGRRYSRADTKTRTRAPASAPFRPESNNGVAMPVRCRDNCAMGGWRWQAWVVVIAVVLGLLSARTAHAQGAKGRAPAETADAQQARRLADEADQLNAQGKYDEALRLGQQGLTLAEKAFGPVNAVVAASLTNLATSYYGKGEHARAEALLLRAQAIREKALGPNDPDLAPVLLGLASLYANKGELTRAEELLLRALVITEKALGPDHPDLANYLAVLASLFRDNGDYASAEPLYQRALTIAEKALGPDHPSLVHILQPLADMHRTVEDFAHAESLFRRALAIAEKALEPDHRDLANVLNGLAALYTAMGDYASAEALYQRALAIAEKAFGPDHLVVARGLHGLANLYLSEDDYARAEPLFQRSLTIVERELAPAHPDVIAALQSLAGLYLRKKDYTRAEPLYQRVLAKIERGVGPDHFMAALPLNQLAVLYTAMGDYARAEPLYQRALAIIEKAFGPDHVIFAHYAYGQAAVYAEQGRATEAIRIAWRATDIEDRHASVVVASGSERQRRLYMATLLQQTNFVVSLHGQYAPASPDAARLALTTLLRRKGRVLDAMTDSLGSLRRSAAPDDRALLEKLTSIYSQLASQASRGPNQTPPEQYRKALASLEEERQSLEAAIGRRSAVFRAEQRLVSLADVQAAVPEGAALVEIAYHYPYPFGSNSPHTTFGKPRYVAYVLRSSGEPAFADLGEAAAIDAAADKLRQALADHDRSHDPKPAARALDKLLMQPIRKLLSGTRWVFLSPDGPLHLVPFGALLDEDNHYLVERYLFSYLTTGRDLLRFDDQHPARHEPPLILANPAFDDSSAPALPGATHRGIRSVDMIAGRLPPLESTTDEARSIAQFFPDSRVLLGAGATEEAVKAAHAPRILHLATHGFFLPAQPIPKQLLQSILGAEPTPAERAALQQRESPLLRSGIALAGFNRRRSGSDDGVLTALETAGLDLYGTRLVVLSTCESGLGEARSGEGVYGLRRALVMAGSETQVMSLWQVDTGRTREMMQAYYQKLQQGGGRSEAMREVQLAMLANPQTAHPNLWASFIVSGEWRTLEGQARLPDVGKVAPGLRGCSCRQAGAGESPREHGLWLIVAIGLGLGALRRSHTRRRGADERSAPVARERASRTSVNGFTDVREGSSRTLFERVANDVRRATTERPPRSQPEPQPGVHAGARAQAITISSGKQRRRTLHGSFFRFDSLTQLVAFCRLRYHTDEVQYDSESGELLLSVELPSGEGFESLIVHFEGEGNYAVMLPDP